ncbi:beta-carotene 15,15'-monooxygenase [Chryseobacterium sp. FH2]|uniref:DUF4153 domain-containing protein n=1 Tax=Chryseobacterium sp. FH2 TaxID=1674291 RepID=UPI00065B088A|nr:DUF4153 domain-containing protein [Chryseobacterium sp. FH2]KMQ68035.1 beta-carotene 15,15'-monooxygenase [Chryseobacterium sp. FH2]
MKTYHYIFLTTALFIILFYGENMGLNLGILGVIYAALTLYKTSGKNRDRTFLVLFITSILSSFAFAWYGDFPSFLAEISSLMLLSFKSKNRKAKTLLIIPVFVTNCFTFVCRFFSFDDWLPKRNISGVWQKTLAFILIPLALVSIFFGIYSAGSDHFANLFNNYELDINVWQLLCISAIGFFIAFNYWNYVVEKYIYKQNYMLDNHFQDKDRIQKPTYSFLDLNSERMSGVISFFALNILLIFFIVTFNYEQFYEVVKTPNQLSEETHERVGAVIGSIIMAILVIMFYFKSSFNFDPKAGLMKILAKTWIFLNVILVFSAMVKNTEYIINYGITYKRLGVYAFLILSLIGLILTLIKIQKQKKNAFLFNTMTWYFYATILVISYVNWGGMITYYNMQRKDFDLDYHKREFYFNKKELLKYAEEKHDEKLRKEILLQVQPQKNESFLSQVIYYQTVR